MTHNSNVPHSFNMNDLKKLRQKLLRDSQLPDLGFEAVASILQLSSSQVREWLATYGDPVQDPVAAVLLANSQAIDGGTLLNTSLNSAELRHKNVRVRLAQDILILLVTALIVFGGTSGDSSTLN